MLAFFRAFAKTWVAKALLGVLAIAFLGWGASNTSAMRQISTDVVSAGSHKVTAADYKRIVTNNLQNISQQQGRAVTPQELVQAGVDQDLLRQLGEATSLWELIGRMGVRPSDTLVAQQLAKIPQLIDPVTRKFDNNAYQRLLRDNGYTTKADQKAFESHMADELAEAQFTAGLLAGLQPPKTYGAILAAQYLQQRDASYFAITPASVGSVAPPTDAQLTDFMKELGPRLQRPEIRSIRLVRLSQAAIAPNVTVSPADVLKIYDERKGSLTTPEKRAFVQVNLRTPADAQVLQARLARGEDLAAAAKGIGAQAITYPGSERGSIPDQSIAQAVFSLAAGQTSGPIKGQFGSAIVRVTAITPASAKSLNEVRAGIEQELRQEAARQKVSDAVRKYNDAHDAGADLAKAAQAAGATVYPIGPINAQGQDGAGRGNPSLTAPMLKDAFSKPQGGETDLVDMGNGEYYALHVDRVVPAAVPPLAEIRPLLAQGWTQREVNKRLKAKADALVARLKAGEGIDAVAASAGTTALTAHNVSQLTAQQFAPLGRGLLAGLFSQKPNAVFTAPGADGQTLYIARVTGIRPGDAGNTMALAQMAVQQSGQEIAGEVRQFAQAAAVRRVKPKSYRDHGLTAIGVDPKSVAGPATPPAGAAGGKAPLAQ